MKKIVYTILATIFGATLMVSCSNDEPMVGEGKVSLKVALNSDVKVIGRAEEDDLAANCTIYVYNSENLIRKYHGIAEVPEEIILVSGDYTAVAWAGDSVPASYTAKYYKGSSPFTISAGSDVRTTIECKIANTVASVIFEPEVDNVLTDYKINIGNTAGSLDFDKTNSADAKGYYMMPDGDKDLTWTITGTQVNGQPFTQTGVIENVKPATEYALTVRYNEKAFEVGGAMLTVEVDETTIDVNDEFILKTAPRITGQGFDIDNPVYIEEGAASKKSVYIASATEVTGIEISCERYTEMGLPAATFDFLTMSATARDAVQAAGITYSYSYDATKDETLAKLTFAKELLDKVTGRVEFVIKATDKDGRVTTKPLVVEVSDAKVITSAQQSGDVTCYTATLRGAIAKPDATNPGFKYRKVGASEWTKVAGTVSGSNFTAKVTGLSSNTAYEYIAVSDDFDSSVAVEFTTFNDPQLTNAGFEDWFTDSDNALVPASSASNLFWDCGNHGSITLNINITTPESSIKHSGNYSIKLKSDFPSLAGIGKFAAGNVFIGKYLRTDGTNGVLGFGRPMASRPVALRGWVKYTPGTIDKTTSSAPSECKKGDPDKGIIYVAMVDGTTKSDNGSAWPVIIKTKSSEFSVFSKDAANVIGYGELTWRTATAGSGLIEFEIPIEYKSDAMPANILITCSASAWGDYFSGSTSSVMYVDDLELVYE